MSSDLWPKREPFMLPFTASRVVFTTWKLWHNVNIRIGQTISFHYKNYCSSDLSFVNFPHNIYIDFSCHYSHVYVLYINSHLIRFVCILHNEKSTYLTKTWCLRWLSRCESVQMCEWVMFVCLSMNGMILFSLSLKIYF